MGIFYVTNIFDRADDTTIAQFRYIKIQPKTIDLRTRLRGLNYRVCGVFSGASLDVYCFRLNFKISKLGYYLSTVQSLLRQL